jgi:hypothetical protein
LTHPFLRVKSLQVLRRGIRPKAHEKIRTTNKKERDMDASKFSLKEATTILKPHLEYLSFKKLGDYLSNAIHLNHGGNVHFCHMRPAVANLPEDLKTTAYVHVMPGTSEWDRKANVILNKTLLIERARSRSIGINWFVEETKFRLRPNTGLIFDGEITEISVLTEKVFEQLISEFPRSLRHFWSLLMDWFEDSVQTRQRVIQNLEAGKVKFKTLLGMYDLDQALRRAA